MFPRLHARSLEPEAGQGNCIETPFSENPFRRNPRHALNLQKQIPFGNDNQKYGSDNKVRE